jgi:phage FluMu protein Com
MKPCPYCKSEIHDGAIRCPHCTSILGTGGQAPLGTKTCPYCKSEIRDDTIRCPHCTSTLDPAKEPDTGGPVTYVLDRDLVRFLKFAGSVLAIFLLLGAFLYGFNLKEATEEIRKAKEELFFRVRLDPGN